MDSTQGLMCDLSHSPPPPPPKMVLPSPQSQLPPIPAELENNSGDPSSPFQIDLLSSPLKGSFGPLLTPPSPNAGADSFDLPPPSPSSPSTKTRQTKRANPLIDLIDSEREYVDRLAGIVRKVAAAWSRNNFPPKELDLMFRGVEAVYKVNRSLLSKLKEIGPNPSSPKALGDLLMRWIDDLDKPYHKYCSNYLTGFDTWDLILSNEKLPPILSSLSGEPSQTPSPEGNVEPVPWTLDTLFALPRARLKYYKKLYGRLLKSTQPGRSDHKLLTSAVSKLESLLAMLSEREGMSVERLEGSKQKPLVPDKENRLLENQLDQVSLNTTGSETADEQGRISMGTSSSGHHSSLSSGAQGSPDAVSDSSSRVTSTATMSMPISHLEKRLSTERVLDLFSLTPKSVRLQMNPPSLPFTRSLRISLDVEIHFSPRTAPENSRIHSRGHIFLLTDLLLIAERMTPEEKQSVNGTPEGQDYDMWLLYPPLAGKHLRVSESSDRDNAIQILILKKETLLLHVQSNMEKEFLMKAFKDCIEAGTLLTPRPGQPAPPPVPPLNFPPRSTSAAHLKQLDSATQNRPLSAPDDPEHPDNQSPQHNQIDPEQDWSALSGSNPSSIRPSSEGNTPDSARQALSSLPPPVSFVPPPRHTSYNNQLGRPESSGSFSGTSTTPGPRLTSLVPFNQPNQLPFRAPNLNPSVALPGPPNPSNWSGRRPSDSLSPPGPYLHKSPSSRSLESSSHNPPYSHIPNQHQPGAYNHPSMPPAPNSFSSMPQLYQPQARAPFPPPATVERVASFPTSSPWPSPSIQEPSPPTSPFEDDSTFSGPVTATVTAQFKCKIFLKVHHGQWKSLGGGRLKLYLQQPTNLKQLVVENDSKDKSILISTIVLTDGVERVGKTGVAIELSDKGARTGIIYMIQLRNEASASGLFDSLLAGSDRAVVRRF